MTKMIFNMKLDDIEEEYNKDRFNRVCRHLVGVDLKKDQYECIRNDIQHCLQDQKGLNLIPTKIKTTVTDMNEGKFFGLDLGGTGFRAYLIDSNGDIVENEKKNVPAYLKTGTAEQLFAFIAEIIAKFMSENKLNFEQPPPLGFSFSYPCIHEHIGSATLQKWTKGFNTSGVVGEEIVGLLRNSCLIKGIKLGVVAVVNDTVATLLACKKKNPDIECNVGLVVATGFNYCYLEKNTRGMKMIKL